MWGRGFEKYSPLPFASYGLSKPHGVRFHYFLEAVNKPFLSLLEVLVHMAFPFQLGIDLCSANMGHSFFFHMLICDATRCSLQQTTSWIKPGRCLLYPLDE